jgi:beta-galactosidase
VTEGTIVAPRESNGHKFWVIVNLDGKGGSVTLPKDGMDLLTLNKVPQGTLELERYEYRIIGF